ncbi:hypothetical protein WG70_09515 [Burkholderia oklahomensis EO147]|nr:hypothetical protein WG70_09515 [Burkholderia oklahomensis EO147]KUY67621.1 hypothetical protein WG70_25550 [Burkholderia oklahomensis EO147]
MRHATCDTRSTTMRARRSSVDCSGKFESAERDKSIGAASRSVSRQRSESDIARNRANDFAPSSKRGA